MRNLFLLGLDAYHRARLASVRGLDGTRFHGLLEPADLSRAGSLPFAHLLRRAERRLESFPGPVDGLYGFQDLPVSALAPLLARRFGLPGPTLESVLRCEHKYWSRLEQQAVVPEHVPRFRLFDPFDERTVDRVDLGYPLWVKPVKSFGSYLGFRVEDRADLRRAAEVVRRGVGPLAATFDRVLELAALPPEVAAATGRFCLAEELVSGDAQCTLEGTVHGGVVRVHGVVDSVRHPGRSTFDRYQYPSRLPPAVCARMEAIAAAVLRRIELDRAAFNAEFFYDAARDHVWLLEINPRIAQHHSELFERVDGAANHQVAAQVALGLTPSLPRREGRYAHAGVFFWREFEDALVARVPAPAEVAALEARAPGTTIQLAVSPGVRLSELAEQDSYSFICALVYVAADDEAELERTARGCIDALGVELRRPVPAGRASA